MHERHEVAELKHIITLVPDRLTAIYDPTSHHMGKEKKKERRAPKHPKLQRLEPERDWHVEGIRSQNGISIFASSSPGVDQHVLS